MPTASFTMKATTIASRGFPRQGKKQGDVVVFTDNITEVNGNTGLRGQHSGCCVLVREPTFWLCEAGYIFPGLPITNFGNGGQLQARGLLDFSTNRFTVAITGGTGDYRLASGHIDLTEPSPGRTDFTVHVET
jgi:hypothetical protein